MEEIYSDDTPVDQQPLGNEIDMFFHCKQCLAELPRGKSPREFVHVEVGWTRDGLQVWCVRHEKNVVNLDFLGQKIAYRNPTKQ